MNELKIQNIFERIFLQKAKFMYKISKSITLSYINNRFTLRTVNKTLLSLRSVNQIFKLQDQKMNLQAKFNIFWASHLERFTRLVIKPLTAFDSFIANA